MPFKKGAEWNGNRGGRPKAAVDFEQFMRSKLVPKALKRLEQILIADDDANSVRAAAIVFDRAYGKPIQPLTHDVPKDGTLATILRNLPRTVGIPKTKM